MQGERGPANTKHKQEARRRKEEGERSKSAKKGGEDPEEEKKGKRKEGRKEGRKEEKRWQAAHVVVQMSSRSEQSTSAVPKRAQRMSDSTVVRQAEQRATSGQGRLSTDAYLEPLLVPMRHPQSLPDPRHVPVCVGDGDVAAAEQRASEVCTLPRVAANQLRLLGESLGEHRVQRRHS